MTNEDYPELDIVLSVLSKQRARFVCYYLMAEDISEVNELFLAREVAVWETGIEPSRVPTERVMQMLEDIQDNLLPRLDEAQFVEYNPAEDTVRYGDPPGPFERIILICQSIEQPKSPQ